VSDDLERFLNARLDEDEQAARAASKSASAQWHVDEEYGETVLWWPPEFHTPFEEDRRWRGQTIESSGSSIAPHIARHDPARVLADVAAKRRIIDEHPNTNDGDCGTCVDGHWGYPVHGGSSPKRWPCTTLRLLALPYAGHPDYREEWQV
jgi:hypothetical protein